MNFRQLIIRNLRGNFRTYAAYFVSSTFAAMVFIYLVCFCSIRN